MMAIAELVLRNTNIVMLVVFGLWKCKNLLLAAFAESAMLALLLLHLVALLLPLFELRLQLLIPLTLPLLPLNRLILLLPILTSSIRPLFPLL